MRECAQTRESELSQQALDALVTELKNRKFSGNHLEIGTAAGGTLKTILGMYSDLHQKIGQFFVVDPMTYFPDQYQIVVENIKSNPKIQLEKVEFIQMKSDEAFRSIQGKAISQLDFILIDGAHKIKYVAQDVRWVDRLNQGGLLCFDDYHAGFDGVDYVVDKIVLESGLFKQVFYVDRLLCLEKVESGRKAISTHQLIVSHLLHPIFQLIASLRKRFKHV